MFVSVYKLRPDWLEPSQDWGLHLIPCDVCRPHWPDFILFHESLQEKKLLYLSNSKPNISLSLICHIQSIFKCSKFALSILRIYPSMAISSASDLFLAFMVPQLSYLGSFLIGFIAIVPCHLNPFFTMQLSEWLRKSRSYHFICPLKLFS